MDLFCNAVTSGISLCGMTECSDGSEKALSCLSLEHDLCCGVDVVILYSYCTVVSSS